MHSLLRGALAKAGAGGDRRWWVVTHRHCTCQLGRHNHDFAKTPKNIKKRQERQRPKRTPPRQGQRSGVGFSICRITTFPGTSLETPPPLQGPHPPSSQPSPPGGAQRGHWEGMGKHGPPGLRSVNHSAQTGVPTREGRRPAALSLTRCARGPASRQQPQGPGFRLRSAADCPREGDHRDLSTSLGGSRSIPQWVRGRGGGRAAPRRDRSPCACRAPARLASVTRAHIYDPCHHGAPCRDAARV